VGRRDQDSGRPGRRDLRKAEKEHQRRDRGGARERRRHQEAADEAYRKQIAAIDKTKDAIEAANVARQAELDVSSARRSARARGSTFPRAAGGTAGASQFDHGARGLHQVVRRRAGGEPGARQLGARGGASRRRSSPQIEREGLRQVAEQAIGALNLPLESARKKAHDAGAALAYLAGAAQRGEISAERYGQVIAEAATQARTEFLSLAASILDEMGATEKSEQVKAMLRKANFLLEVAQLNIMYAALANLGDAGIALQKELGPILDFVNDPKNWPDFSKVAGAAGAVDKAGGAVDSAANALLDAVKALRQFTDSLLLDERLTTLTPQQQEAEARKQLAAAQAAARTGDPDAIRNLMDVERQVLDVFRRNEASGQGYQDVFSYIVELNRTIEAMFGAVPHYAAGGITRSGGLAYLHPNEAVVPLKNGAIPVSAPSNDNGTDHAKLSEENIRQRSAENAALHEQLVGMRRELEGMRGEMERARRDQKVGRRAGGKKD
jgi:hypothetical protein